MWIRSPFHADLLYRDGDLAKDDRMEIRTMQMLRNELNWRILVFLSTCVSSSGKESHDCSSSFCCNHRRRVWNFYV